MPQPNTVGDAEERYEEYQALKDFANGIHGEADELIDIPFTQRLEPVMQSLYDLNPKEFHTEPTFLGIFGGKSLEELLLSTIDSRELKKEYKSMFEALDKDKIGDDNEIINRLLMALGGMTSVVPNAVTSLKALINLLSNRKYDKEIASRDYLVGQNVDPIFKDMQYGILSDHAGTACELIASYNALKFMGYDVTYSNLVYQAETTATAQMGFGMLGTNPYMVDALLRENGAKTTEYGSAKALDQAMKAGDVAVVSNWNKKDTITGGLHTYTVKKTNDGLEWYNYMTGRDTPLSSSESIEVEDTVSATLENDERDYIVGYIVK